MRYRGRGGGGEVHASGGGEFRVRYSVWGGRASYTLAGPEMDVLQGVRWDERRGGERVQGPGLRPLGFRD